MVWNASRVFHGRNPNWPGLVLGALGWIATVVTLAPEASALRLTIGAGIVAVYAALTAVGIVVRAAPDAAEALARGRGTGAAWRGADAADRARRLPASTG